MVPSVAPQPGGGDESAVPMAVAFERHVEVGHSALSKRVNAPNSDSSLGQRLCDRTFSVYPYQISETVLGT